MKAATILALIPLVAAHGAIIKATAPAGGSGMALGVDTSTPRDGTRRDPFQADSTRFKGANAATVGQTVGGGENDLEAGTKAIIAETGDQLPQIEAGGQIQLTVHQVNGDGAGPYACMVNSDATAQTWTDIKVTTNVPGDNGRNRVSSLPSPLYTHTHTHIHKMPDNLSQDGATTDFPLNAAIPADQACTGTVAGQENICLVRCQNPARAGPFGGVVPVQLASANNTAAAARRALALAVKRDSLSLTKMRKRSSIEEEAASLGMSVVELEELRADGEEI